MKNCQNCGHENSDEMSYCVECGSALKLPPQMVVPLDTLESSLPFPETGAESFDTLVIKRSSANIEPLSTIRPQSSKKIFAILGVIGAVVLLIFGAAGVAFYSYWNSSNRLVSKPEKSPTGAPPAKKEIPKPSAAPKPKPSETPTANGSFTIEGDSDDWQTSEIATVSEETFLMNVSGSIILDGISENVSAKGVSGNPERRLMKEFPTGALLMRTRYPDGKVSEIQAAADSESWENSQDEHGKLEFLINDNEPENNEGEFTVEVTLVEIP